MQRTQTEQYVPVFLDIPGTGSVPFHLYNQDAFKPIDKVRVPNGLLITNQVLFLMPGANQIAHSTAATLSSVFPNVEAFDIYPDESDQGLTNLLMMHQLSRRATKNGPVVNVRLYLTAMLP